MCHINAGVKRVWNDSKRKLRSKTFIFSHMKFHLLIKLLQRRLEYGNAGAKMIDVEPDFLEKNFDNG